MHGEEHHDQHDKGHGSQSHDLGWTVRPLRIEPEACPLGFLLRTFDGRGVSRVHVPKPQEEQGCVFGEIADAQEDPVGHGSRQTPEELQSTTDFWRKTRGEDSCEEARGNEDGECGSGGESDPMRLADLVGLRVSQLNQE